MKEAMGARNIKYLERSVNRHGRERFYVRLPGKDRVRVDDPAGPEEIAVAFKIAHGEADKPAAKASRAPKAEKGSLRHMIGEYVASEEFKDLDARTQKVRRAILESICLEPHKDDDRYFYAECPAKKLTAQDVKAIRDRKGVALPEAANGRVKALRQLYAWAIEAEETEDNPAARVKYLASHSQGHHAWTLAEVEAFETCHPVGTKARLALALLIYLAQRRADIVAIGPQHIRDGWLTLTQNKNARNNPITLELPVIPELARIIAATPTGHMAFLVTEFGKPFTSNGFGNRFRKWCDEAALPQCSAHGLRKAAAARLANLGCSARQIMAITGHQTIKEVERYTKSAEQRTLAKDAMAKMDAGQKANNFASPKPDNAQGGAKTGAK